MKKEVDAAFINDNYPILFPLKAYWDSSATVIDHGKDKTAGGQRHGRAGRGEVSRGKRRYTPGDTWELYIGKHNRIEYLAFERGGPVKPSLFFATWAGHKKAGPLLISTDHRGMVNGRPTGIWCSDVSVKVTGSDTWMKAE